MLLHVNLSPEPRAPSPERVVSLLPQVLGVCCAAMLLGAGAVSGGETPLADGQSEAVAGYIFGVPVSASNYAFAKRVALMFPRPWEEGLSAADRERAVWEALILHYEAFRRGVEPSAAELEDYINQALRSQQLAFTRAQDPQAYARWVQETLGEPVELFENQMRYLLQIDTLKETMRGSFAITVTDEEIRQEFLNEQHHVGGEYALFPSQAEAQAFYETVRSPNAWEVKKRDDPSWCRPFSLITLEAIIDLWGVSKEQIYAFHAMEPGSVGPPMPFGTTQWGVFRLLEKRTGDLKELPKRRTEYQEQLKAKQRHEALRRWVEELKASAQLRIVPLEAQSIQKSAVGSQRSDVRPEPSGDHQR
jgi:hypothetical protein